MSEIDGVSKGNYYSDRDIEGLRGNEKVSTGAAINQIGNHAGLGDTHTIHGYDKTEAQIREDSRDGVLEEGTGGLVHEGNKQLIEHTVEGLAEHGGTRLAFRMISGALLPITVMEAGVDMTKAVADDAKVGHERAGAIVRDAMHLVIVGNLNGLPQGYVDAQRARYSNDVKNGSLAANMQRQLGRSDNGTMAIIQLHCDHGMTAARAMVDSKSTPADFMSAHPDVGKRYQSDPAFRHGFDGLVFAAQHGTYAATVHALDARDARYDAAHVAWRG